MPRRGAQPGHGLVAAPSHRGRADSDRRQGHGPPQARLPGNAGLRHVVGLVPRARGHVVAKVPPEARRLPRRRPELPPRHRGPHARHQSAQEGVSSQPLPGKPSSSSSTQDLASSGPIVISLPIATLPHVITPSLALSTLADLLPRLSHSHANIRKKTLVTLYRLALVYPEALRAAWPKIKERLMDPAEDPSVTAAIVNVVCELGWRRPHDFLPLAPRLFELLVDGGNNWMAIKLIKLVRPPPRPPVVLQTLTCISVCHAYSPRTPPREEAAASPHQHHGHDGRHVSPLRMHQRHHPGRHPRQWR